MPIPAIDLSSDRPITSPAEDLLGRTGFAASIAKAIASWQGNDSLILAVYGPWGSGKSSVKNLIMAELTKRPSGPRIVEFNPWAWSGKDRLLGAFFAEVATAIDDPHGDQPDSKALAKKWRKYGARLALGSTVVGHLKTASSVLPVPGLPMLFGGLGWLAGKSAELARLSAEAHEADEAEEPSLSNLKAQVADALVRLDRPLLVVLDDVDRLQKEEIRLLFQLVKINADFPKMIYLLLFQREIIEDALANGESDTGRAYMEKIVQAGFDLPRPERGDVAQVLFAGLDKLVEDEVVHRRFSLRRWTDAYLNAFRPFFETIRDVRRFLSCFAFSLGLFIKEQTLEVNMIDLLGLEILRLFEAEVYHFVAADRKFLLNEDPNLASGQEELAEQKKHFESILSLATEERRMHVSKLLCELFPEMSGLAGGFALGGGFSEKWARNLRVCHPNYFDRYFQLDIPRRDVPQAAIEDVVAVSGNRVALVDSLRKFIGKGKLKDLLMRFSEGLLGDIPEANIQPFITSMLDVADELPPRNGDPFDPGAELVLIWVVNGCLDRIKEIEQRSKVFLGALQDTSGVCVAIGLVRSESERAATEVDSSRRKMVDDDLREARIACCGRVALAAKQGRIPQERLDRALWNWKALEAENGPEEFVAGLTGTLKGALTFIAGFVRERTAQSAGSYHMEKRPYIRLASISPLVDIDTLVETLKPVLGDDRDQACVPDIDEYEVPIKAFRAALKRQKDGKPDDPTLFDEDEG